MRTPVSSRWLPRGRQAELATRLHLLFGALLPCCHGQLLLGGVRLQVIVFTFDLVLTIGLELDVVHRLIC